MGLEEEEHQYSKLPEEYRRMSNSEKEAIGDRLTLLMMSEWSRKGYWCVPNLGHSAGVDLVVYEVCTGKVVAVIECKNWQKEYLNGTHPQVPDDKFTEDLFNLNQYDSLPNVEKWYVVSFVEILSYDERIAIDNSRIRLRIMGFQA